MPNFATLAQLRTRVLQAADATTGQASTFLSATEVNGYINDSYSELHDILIMRFKNYARTVVTFPLVANQELYTLPDDYYKTSSIWWMVGTERILLREFPEREIEQYQRAPTITYRGIIPHYRIDDNSLFFVPLPSGTGTIEHRYIPQYKKLYNDSDTLAIYVVNGWEEYIVVDAAIKCKDRMGLDCARLDIRKAGLSKRIEDAASDRDAGSPQRVTDVGRVY